MPNLPSESHAYKVKVPASGRGLTKPFRTPNLGSKAERFFVTNHNQT